MSTRFLITCALLLGLAFGCDKASSSGAASTGGKADAFDPPAADHDSPVKDVRVTILSTNLGDTWSANHHGDSLAAFDGQTGDTIGHEGWSALVEVEYATETRKILFDVGSRPDVILKNAAIMGIDLSEVEELVLSHWHYDHTDSLVPLREALMEDNPRALATVYVSKWAFAERNRAKFGPDGSVTDYVRGDDGEPKNVNTLAAKLEAFKATFPADAQPEIVETGYGAFELGDHVWLTGFVPRGAHKSGFVENSFPKSLRVPADSEMEVLDDDGKPVVTVDGGAADIVPDDLSLVASTSRGLTVVTGCSHSGIGNIVRHAKTIAREKLGVEQDPFVVVGGLHLIGTSRSYLRNVAEVLSDEGVQYILGGHCTGINSPVELRELLGADENHVTIASVGFGVRTSRVEEDLHPIQLGWATSAFGKE